MQVAPVRPVHHTADAAARRTAGVPAEGSVTQAVAAASRTALALPPLPSLSGALRAMETLLLAGGQRTARRNAWTAVLEDRSRAKDRVETQHVLEAVSDATSHAT
ncbi:hypothetical protein [Streptomyces sp. NPDC091212]|uniref:SCO2195 family GlnR-regulated protein n=1 Tax=Streptomyces sp. NPDC091212 TaxID=3155191 RepID=UPI003436CEA5